MSYYYKLRGQIYYQELKQMLASLSQLFAFLMMMLYLAIPASILTALVSISVIADIHTPPQQRVLYQWGYFILVYVLLRIQKNAILAQSYQPYMASLVVSARQKYAATFLLTLAAGNLPLLTPVFLLGYMPNWQTFIAQLHFPLFALSTLVVAWISLKNKAFPWLTLCLAPIALYIGGMLYPVSPVLLNTCVLLLLLAEALFAPLAGLSLQPQQVSHYWQIRWIAILKRPATLIGRIFFCVLFIGLVAYVQAKMALEANSVIQLLVCWVLALVIGSYQFDNERFYREHPHYLAGLLSQHSSRYLQDAIPALLLAVISSLVIIFWLNFSVAVLLLLTAGTVLTIIGVTKFSRNFFILPGLFYSLYLIKLLMG